ncbi:hypothetical protein PSECIP111951_00125 [Pseudoalteromonas holothuriae]|uniref:Uncharacterized protein n=1 Tax=Pseudoalteromonas holothuriae TaxID=2963714 RepID=A0ABM9GEW6_9GAMM|nr:hypothetical protein [Pseudoalteromonas sp. CIP111951]CAH9050120.1 hypothetical protein PSECIP111951_00125 [Pseudoalteromonas sp. CIP111951]
MVWSRLFAKLVLVLGIASALILCGWLLTSTSQLDGNVVVQIKVLHTQIDNEKELVQPRLASNAQLFLHELQSKPLFILVFIFALLCIRHLPYKSLLFFKLLPWYWRCHPPSKLKVSLWRDTNILIRQTAHSLSL